MSKYTSSARVDCVPDLYRGILNPAAGVLDITLGRELAIRGKRVNTHICYNITLTRAFYAYNEIHYLYKTDRIVAR